MSMIGDVVLNNKHKTILSDFSKRVEFFEGVTGSSKSLIAGIKFLYRIFESNKMQFFVCGESASALERNIIDNPMGFVQLFPDICNYKKQGRGGSRVEIKTDQGTKTVYLVGYTSADKWKKILGSTSGGFFVDEINIASEDFVEELFTRLARDNGFLICTSNGDDDELFVYQRYLNKCYPHPDYIKDIPASTLRDLDNHPEKDEDYLYYFFSFKDNPTKTEQHIKNLMDVHPPGSWAYKTKIIGERGTLEGAVYADFMKARHTVSYENIMSQPSALLDLEIGVDLGGEGKTVFTISGFTRNWARMIVLDSYLLEGVPDAQGIAEQLNDWLLPYWVKYGRKIRNINVDDDTGFVVRTIRNNMSVPIDVKKAKKPPIPDRIITAIQMMYKDRMLFTDSEGAQEVRRQLLKIKSDGTGGYLEEDKIHNDYQDAWFYTFTRHLKRLSRYILNAHEMKDNHK